jgi:anti-sigma factor RsiW
VTQRSFTQAELEAYLDEALPPEEMALIEKAVRESPHLPDQLAAINGRRDSGVHSLGDIWRRHRVTCPPREQLGSYLLGTLPPEVMEYVAFHLEMAGCRFCRANLADLKTQQADGEETVVTRRRKYFQSSAGYLRRTAQ